MSTKHFFSSTEGVVVLGLEALVTRNLHLQLDVPNKVVYSKTHSTRKIALIAGGGSGHEPAWSGYVGDGMLAAAVNGEVFASPSTKQIMAAIRHVPSDVGIILCITNYTGDNLHFGLAREKALGLGHKIGILRMTDDVALGRRQTENVGRRGLAGNIFVLKLCGAAAEQGYAFDTCLGIGQAGNDNCVTVGSSLDHCHIPGREHHRAIPQSAYVLGMGIHNEPGLHEIDPMPPVEQLVGDMLRYCLDPTDDDRAFVKVQPDDTILMLVNNFGGLSSFELAALTTVTRRMLKKYWDIVPVREYVQCFESSLNAPGWSISLLNLTGVSRDTNQPVPTLLALLDSPTAASAWPKNGYQEVEAPRSTKHDSKLHFELQAQGPVPPKSLEPALRAGLQACLARESDITKWDVQMGDGDCGEAVASMCTGVLKKLDSGICDTAGLFHVLDEIVDAVEDVGGTLAAILAILLASFTTSLRQTLQNDASVDTSVVSKSASLALEKLMGYTSARAGGRTVMDCLVPFCNTFESTTDLTKAVQAAERGAESTRGMKAQFGRATYVGEQAQTGDNPPDPGASAVLFFLQGLQQAYDST